MLLVACLIQMTVLLNTSVLRPPVERRVGGCSYSVSAMLRSRTLLEGEIVTSHKNVEAHASINLRYPIIQNQPCGQSGPWLLLKVRRPGRYYSREIRYRRQEGWREARALMRRLCPLPEQSPMHSVRFGRGLLTIKNSSQKSHVTCARTKHRRCLQISTRPQTECATSKSYIRAHKSRFNI